MSDWAHKRMGVRAVIRDDEGRVLLVKHDYGEMDWSIPGGKVEEDESMTEAVAREVREEAGTEVKAEALTGIYYNPEDDSHHFVFLCRRLDASEKLRTKPDEISDAAYWPTDTLPHPVSNWTVHRIRDALSESPQKLPEIVPSREWLDTRERRP